MSVGTGNRTALVAGPSFRQLFDELASNPIPPRRDQLLRLIGERLDKVEKRRQEIGVQVAGIAAGITQATAIAIEPVYPFMLIHVTSDSAVPAQADRIARYATHLALSVNGNLVTLAPFGPGSTMLTEITGTDETLWLSTTPGYATNVNPVNATGQWGQRLGFLEDAPDVTGRHSTNFFLSTLDPLGDIPA